MNDSSDAHMKNTSMAAYAYENGRVTATIGAGREVVRGAGTNVPAFENRVTPGETGTH